MTKSHYPYPPDEFDTRGTEGAPVGVHREPRRGWSAAWPFLLVAVVFAGVAVGVVSFLSEDPGPTGANPTAAVTQGGEAAAEGGDGADGGEEGGGEGGEASTEPPAEEDGDAAEPDGESPAGGVSDEQIAELVAAADPTAPIVIENASAAAGAEVPGLAGDTADLLKAEGFTDVATADYLGSGAPASSVVRYVGDRAESAAAVAAVLGIPESEVAQVDSLSDGREIAAVMIAPAGG